MTYLYIANAPEDNSFAQKLSQDLKQHTIDHWYDDGQADESTNYSHLQKATHVVLVLSPAILLNEKTLAALEHAKQSSIERIVLRIAPVDTMPPQISGVLPINASTDDSYQDALETLLEDVRLPETAPRPEIPAEIIEALNSDNSVKRKEGVESLRAYRQGDPVMKELAREELQAMMFREQDKTIRSFVRLILQSFDKTTDELQDEDAVTLPTKEDLATVSGEHAVVVDPSTTPETAPAAAPAQTNQYFWQSSRWNLVLMSLAIFFALGAVAGSAHLAAAIPMLAVGLFLPPFNIVIRGDGNFNWSPTGAIFWNFMLSLLIGTAMSIIVSQITDNLTLLAIPLSMILAGMYGLIVGWLSTVKV